jgi:hypothetical protein
MICPVCITATEQIAKLDDPPPAGSTEVYTNLTRGGSSIGRLTSASTCGSGNARVVLRNAAARKASAAAEVRVCV